MQWKLIIPLILFHQNQRVISLKCKKKLWQENGICCRSPVIFLYYREYQILIASDLLPSNCGHQLVPDLVSRVNYLGREVHTTHPHIRNTELLFILYLTILSTLLHFFFFDLYYLFSETTDYCTFCIHYHTSLNRYRTQLRSCFFYPYNISIK